MESRANTYGSGFVSRRRKEAPWNKSRKTVSVRRLMGEGRETLRDDPNND